MELRVEDVGPTKPFYTARDRFAAEWELELPVEVELREDPDERTLTGHYDDHHVLVMSRQAATSAMAVELACHEFAHMYRYEQAHPSHHLKTEEALFLALAGHSVERRKLAHVYQIANHMKDIYADDLTLAVTSPVKLVDFMESSLAAALADRPAHAPDGWVRQTTGADPDITAVNAAFALALLERHDAIDPDHRLYALARAAGADAPGVRVETFKEHFRSLARETDESTYRKALVDVTREYVLDSSRTAAAD
ncbi:DUF5781 family protein [Natronomonas sp. EA1]|uniref:DUF5781 family protein n=1 Tax=Natronomonas sp. EA1 TaxID=3421655 RepID=UPI003EBF7837